VQQLLPHADAAVARRGCQLKTTRGDARRAKEDAMRAGNAVGWSLAAALMCAAPALAQSDTAPGNAIALAAGAGSTASRTGVAIGGSFLVDIGDRYGLEIQGTYLDRGPAADAFSAIGSFVVNLVSAERRVVPYAAGGGGVHRATFDLGDPRFFGPVGSQLPAGTVVCPAPGRGAGMGPGAGFGSDDCTVPAAGYWGVNQMERFYARQLGPMMVPLNARWEERTFVDPAISLGGGVRFNVSERIMIRPDVRAQLLFDDGDAHAVGVFVVNAGYRF
jgi:hypothetical protein